MPELLRSMIGESGQYTPENRQILGQRINYEAQQLTEYLTTALERSQVRLCLPAEKIARLVYELLFGYQVMELLTEFHELWPDQEDFLRSLTALFLASTIPSGSPELPTDKSATTLIAESSPVADLSAETVHAILQQAKKQGSQDYGIAYILFGSGLTPAELVRLERSHRMSNSHQHLLQIPTGNVRQVPVNQWILGKRYGSYTNNPLSQWLKSRKDEQSALFINQEGRPLSVAELETIWQHLVTQALPADQGSPALEQARQTWCVEMLTKGISLEDLSILSGWSISQLRPYQHRAREKAALDRAIRLDQKA